ncbi:hypothetical protein GBA52_017254 [Prunus armeniaca]|nr:hypothetical protein GBA52_017254 [Prunus armeniaca]
MLGKRVQLANADLSTKLGPTVPPIPVIKSHSGPEVRTKNMLRNPRMGAQMGPSHLLMVVKIEEF